MKKIKKAVGFVCMVIMLFASLNVQAFAESTNPDYEGSDNVKFTDVPDDFWAKDEIYYFATQGIVTGVGNDKFNPNGIVTREQFTKMLVLAFNAPLKTPGEPTFADVNSNMWSYPYIETCKEFLTGYSNVFGGKPSFKPTQAATREDIAVALVKMMGLTDQDVEDSNYANDRFIDSEDISPQLMKYVSLASERKLINGYKNGNFYPKKGITRAETVTLINRATKQAMSNIDKELKLEVSIVKGENPEDVSVMILTEEGAKVTVDGKTIKLSSNGEGGYEGIFNYKFESEYSKVFNVQGSKLGKTASKTIEAKYEIGKPVLKITNCPTSVTSKDITISGTMFDKNYGTELLINGKTVASNESRDYLKDWSKSYTLQEGANTFEFVLKNKAGKEAKETKTIYFSVDGPVLKIANCPTEVTTKDITIYGTIFDSNYGTELLINGSTIVSNEYSNDLLSWSKSYTLQEGVNTFEFVLKNRVGKVFKETKKINFSVGGPVLEITNCPTEVTSKDVIIYGTMFDKNYGTELLINGNTIASNENSNFIQNWSKSYTLQEGANTFEFVLKNKAGKETKETRVIMFEVGSPQILFDSWKEVSDNNQYTVSGRIVGEAEQVTLYLNDEEVILDSSNRFSKSLALKEGDNTFVFRAINIYGKSQSVSKTIRYAQVTAPTLELTQ